MAIVNVGQDVANKIDIVAYEVAKSYPLWQAVKMRRYGSLININPSAFGESLMLKKLE